MTTSSPAILSIRSQLAGVSSSLFHEAQQRPPSPGLQRAAEYIEDALAELDRETGVGALRARSAACARELWEDVESSPVSAG